MKTKKEALASHLIVPSRIENEISIIGKWVPSKKGVPFFKSKESKEMVQEWEDIHQDAKQHHGMLSTEINHAIGQDAVLVHHVFQDADALTSYFSNTASAHAKALSKVANPEKHLVRGTKISDEVKQALADKNVDADFGEYIFGYVKDDYRRPNPEHAIQVTAKWTCKPEMNESMDELIYWWQQVGTEAFTLEKGLVRFEAYKVEGEDALIIHETFDSSDELKFHLSKGTAEKYKKDIDKIAFPECYFFRGPVSWTIRTYSKFLKLPATYSNQGSHYSRDGGNMIDGTF